VIGLAGLLSHMVIQNISERNWSSAIRKAMKEPTVASALDLVAKLQKNSPKLCERPGLTALIREVETMKINEEKKRKDFTRRADVFRKGLSNFAINREKLAEGLEELSRLVVDGREKEVLDKLTQDYTAQLELFQMQQLAVFDRIVAQINEKRGRFYTTLEKTDVESAKKIIAEIGLLEKKAAKIYAVIGKAFPGRENDFRQSEALTQRLNETTGKIARAGDIMPSIQSPMGLAQLRQNISDYLSLLPASPDTETLTKLSGSAKFAEGIVAVLENGTVADNIFSKDLERVKQIQKNSSAALGKISGKYDKLAKYYKNNPVHAFIAKTTDGLIIDLYYTLSRPQNAKGSQAAYRYQGINANFKYNPLRAMKDEEGTTLDVLLSGTRGKKDVTVEIDGKTWKGEALYPESWDKEEVHRGEISGGNIAPYIRGVQAINSILQRADKNNAEPALHEALKILLDNELINSVLRKNYCHDIIDALLILDPSNPSYQSIKESLAAVPKPSGWLLSFKENPDAQKKVQDILAAARAGELRQRQTFFLKLWNALTEAKLTPAGYISNKGGKRVFHQIYDAPEAGDLYLIDDTVTTLIGRYENGEIRLGANAEKLKIDYVILFTPKNANALKSARAEAEKMSKEQGFSSTDCPASWPIF